MTSMCSLLTNEYKDTKCGHCNSIMNEPICINGIVYDRQHIIEYAKANNNMCPQNIIIKEDIMKVSTILSIKKKCRKA